MPPLPNTNSSPYPSNQAMPPGMPFGAGFAPPAYPPSSTTGYPPQQYPPLPNPYPSNNMPNAGPIGGYGSGANCYPPNPMHANPSYATQQIPNYPPQTHFSAQGYTGHGYQQASTSAPGYPNVNNMAACFSEMQGHIKDVRRSKVCVCVCVYLC